MIQDVDETLKNLLIARGRMDEAAIDISFDQPTGEWAGSLTRPTINCYLYDIRENVELRSRDFKVSKDYQTGKTQRVFDPLRVDLSYILTVWTRNIRDEHALLSRVLSVLAPIRVIHPKDAEPGLHEQLYDMPVKVALPSEAIRNLPDLWGVMENQLRPALNFVITVALDLKESIEAPMVLTAQIDVGRYGSDMIRTLRNQPPTLVEHVYHVGGVLYRDDKPLPNATLNMVDHPFSVTTDGTGRYAFVNLAAGDYALTIMPEGSTKAQKTSIKVPSEQYDLKAK